LISATITNVDLDQLSIFNYQFSTHPMLPKFFLDSCDPAQTKEMIATVGKIDGQTTNPTLLVKNPEVQKYVAGSNSHSVINGTLKILGEGRR
jgi:hypothetical protein